ncbi:hypothetical protein [Bradyrhizobium sp. Gha]|uniref:hypothetical protein n=1 Tax=Bradyrhizobium sp. Gha TaxID=1855318 RepID=UPI0008F43965|nr:hypothetical protein [Bradyrhizobium sp. Gha]SFJ60436.1 hypothetical protein SAMN05216525_12976 [Bradyrhizobium sp. Gha]
MAVHERWQMDASAPELYERYLVPLTSVWADGLLDRIGPTKGEAYGACGPAWWRPVWPSAAALEDWWA